MAIQCRRPLLTTTTGTDTDSHCSLYSPTTMIRARCRGDDDPFFVLAVPVGTAYRDGTGTLKAAIGSDEHEWMQMDIGLVHESPSGSNPQ